MSNIIYWFRNNLRLHDNESLLKAHQKGRVIPVYVIDDTFFETTSLGFQRMGVHRAKFLLESLAALKANLQSVGSDLIIMTGKPEEKIVEIAVKYRATHVIGSKAATQEETKCESAISIQLKPHNIDFELSWDSTLYHARDLPFQIHYLPAVFTEFRKKIEQNSKVRPTLETVRQLPSVADIPSEELPTLETLGYEKPQNDPRSAFLLKGGETEALTHLNRYVWEKELPKTYKETRNGLLGQDYSSKLSAYLSLGCLSPRKIYEEIRAFEEKVIENQSTYWLIFELLWRDYFYFIALKYGVRIFKRCGIKHDMEKQWKADKEGFEKWKNGETGVPFVDANMRELKATGFMSNRGRQNVSSFLAKELGIEWWWGAMYFEHQLIDYDVCNNWGNWNYVAGIGTDPREDRYFNILKQASQYDPTGEYTKQWLPELKNVPLEKLQTPHLLTSEEQQTYGVTLGKEYPTPIFDTTKWMKKS